MNEVKEVSKKTQQNWQINAVLFFSASIAMLSGIYFLFFPSGFQGGRNQYYNMVILFDRYGWDMIHTWTGVTMIAAATLHLITHWKWFVNMAKRMARSIFGKTPLLNKKANFNLAINGLMGLSFFIAAITGVYFLYYPGGRAGNADPMILFNRFIWDLLHTWSGVIVAIAAMLHIVIHWKWVVKVTRRYFQQGIRKESPRSVARSQQKTEPA